MNPTLVPGTRLGPYEIVALIGSGGMGEVYRARDTNTDRIIALKVLPVQMARDTVFQERFRREAQAASGVNDPHVVPIHGYGEIDGRLYLDMRLIEGENLGNLLAQRDTPLGPRLGAVVVDDVLGYFETKYANDWAHQARAYNLRLAASKLDGHVIMPGEVFDF